jgi:hypothetical protein
MGWMTWESGLIPGSIKYVSAHYVDTSSVAQKSSYPIGIRASLGMNLTTYLHLTLRLKMCCCVFIP